MPAGLVQLAERSGGRPSVEGERVEIAVPDARTAQAILAAHGDAVRDFEFRHGRMDDVFLALTGRTVDALDKPDSESDAA